MARCIACKRTSPLIAEVLGLCLDCLRAGSTLAEERVEAVHATTRRESGLVERPPRSPGGVNCQRCFHQCQIGENERGYCGVRREQQGRLAGGTPEGAYVSWYLDALPTNCVSGWVCPAETGSGYPTWTDCQGIESGYYNLAVTYEACNFDCLFCQNWQSRQSQANRRTHSAESLALAVNPRTRCICYFGGDPGPQIEHALAASRAALARSEDRILRICWETNGAMRQRFLQEVVELSLASGGCVKFDLKAWHPTLHRALTGADNAAVLANLAWVAGRAQQRPAPPLLVASTLLVPGYVDEEEVGEIAGFLASLNRDLPYSLLAFHPDCYLSDLPVTSSQHAQRCVAAAEAAGLSRVHLGNAHLLGMQH